MQSPGTAEVVLSTLGSAEVGLCESPSLLLVVAPVPFCAAGLGLGFWDSARLSETAAGGCPSGDRGVGPLSPAAAGGAALCSSGMLQVHTFGQTTVDGAQQWDGW